jgi:hypothetical protein
MEEKDEYINLINENWGHIFRFYKIFEDKNPIMLFDIQELRIYAYPYAEYRKELSKRSQDLLKTQYAEALANDQIVVFIRDNERKKLRSYSFRKE